MSVDIFDSDQPAAVPTTAPGVAFYIDQPNPATAADWARFAGKPQLAITRNHVIEQAHAIDYEAGAATIAEVVQWVKLRMANKRIVIMVYASLNNWPQLDAALTGLHYQRWVAHWTGKSHTEKGAAMVQWADSTMTGGHWDRSTLFDMGIAAELTHPITPPPKPLDLLKQAQAALAAATGDIDQAIKALGG